MAGECLDAPVSKVDRIVSIRADANGRRGRIAEIRPLAILLCAAALILGFGLLAEEVFEGDAAAFDAHVAGLFRSAGSATPIGPPWLQEMARDVTSLGSYALLGLILLTAVGYLLLVYKRATALFLTGSVVGGMVLSTLLKLAFNRPRPDLPTTARVFTASFPSGHAMLSAVTFLTLATIVARAETDPRIKAYFVSIGIFLTVAVGVSRVYIGVHYATDVLAGWCAGSAWAILCWALANRLEETGWLEQSGKR